MSAVCNVRNLGTSFDNHLSMKTPLSTRLVNQDFTICIILGALNDILASKIESIVQAIVISRIDYCMVLPLRTFASSNGCKTRHSERCDLCQDTNTSHRHLYVFTGCRLSLESISRLLCSVSSAFMGQVSKKHGRQQEDFDIQPPLEHQYAVGRPFTTIEKIAWRWSLFLCIRQDLEHSPAIIKVTAKFQHL